LRLFREAENIGVSVLLLAGGEPLLRPEVLRYAARHKNLLTLTFTNGTLITDEFSAWFSRHRNVIPVISVEGGPEATDVRRGEGVYRRVSDAMGKLSALGVPFGLSITATRENVRSITSDDFALTHIKLGCRAFLYIEYVPVEEDGDPLLLTEEDRALLLSRAQALEDSMPALFIPFPGNEDLYGGCMASARGFAYISAQGALTPCPFSPVSDRSVKDLSLKKTLSSPLLQSIRENRGLLKEGAGGCALWNNREWLESLTGKQSKP
jgi:MoaA/NifB/PqqE/SkfB family radical SAM enzyme